MHRTLLVLAAFAAAPAMASPTPYRCDGVAIRATAEPSAIERRVRVQHDLLVLAQRLASGDETERAMSASVMRLVKAIAPTSAELAAAGSGTEPRVAAIFGDLALAQRATRSCGTGDLIHVYVAGGLLAYRPLRAGNTRALVAQLVAFDRAGQPHVTPFVEEAELRFGDAVDAPACVVQSDERGELHAMAIEQLRPRPPFVMRSEAGIGCRSCHYAANAFEAHDITGAELERVDAARTRQVDRLARDLWHRLEP